jgi:hypothetical protein
MYFMCLGKKDIYSIFMACTIIFVSFYKKCHVFHNSFFLNNMFFLNHAQKCKYQPSQIKVKLYFFWLCIAFSEFYFSILPVFLSLSFSFLPPISVLLSFLK